MSEIKKEYSDITLETTGFITDDPGTYELLNISSSGKIDWSNVKIDNLNTDLVHPGTRYYSESLAMIFDKSCIYTMPSMGEINWNGGTYTVHNGGAYLYWQGGYYEEIGEEQFEWISLGSACKGKVQARWEYSFDSINWKDAEEQDATHKNTFLIRKGQIIYLRQYIVTPEVPSIPVECESIRWYSWGWDGDDGQTEQSSAKRSGPLMDVTEAQSGSQNFVPDQNDYILNYEKIKALTDNYSEAFTGVLGGDTVKTKGSGEQTETQEKTFYICGRSASIDYKLTINLQTPPYERGASVKFSEYFLKPDASAFEEEPTIVKEELSTTTSPEKKQTGTENFTFANDQFYCCKLVVKAEAYKKGGLLGQTEAVYHRMGITTFKDEGWTESEYNSKQLDKYLKKPLVGIWEKGSTTFTMDDAVFINYINDHRDRNINEFDVSRYSIFGE